MKSKSAGEGDAEAGFGGADLNSKGEAGINPFRVLKYNVLKAGCYVPGMAVDEAALYVWLGAKSGMRDAGWV